MTSKKKKKTTNRVVIIDSIQLTGTKAEKYLQILNLLKEVPTQEINLRFMQQMIHSCRESLNYLLKNEPLAVTTKHRAWELLVSNLQTTLSKVEG